MRSLLAISLLFAPAFTISIKEKVKAAQYSHDGYDGKDGHYFDQ